MVAIEVLEDGMLKEICAGTGSRVGGQDVNNAFFQSCKDVIEGNAWHDLASKNAEDLLTMEKEFEDRKVQIGTGDALDEKIKVTIPASIRKMLENGEIKIKPGMEKSNYFKITKEKLMYDSTLVRDVLFNETVDIILKSVHEFLGHRELRRVKTVVLVGGFAESQIAVYKIRSLLLEKHPNVKVVVPTSPFKAVLTGAVLYGHDPMIFLSRIGRATFGIDSNMLFDSEKHDTSKKWRHEEDGKDYCKDIFSIHVRKNQPLRLKAKQPSLTYKPTYQNKISLELRIFSSPEQEPKYTTEEGCKQIGKITVDMQDTTGGTDRTVKVEMIYGGTELSVIATDERTGKEFPADIKFDTF